MKTILIGLKIIKFQSQEKKRQRIALSPRKQ